MQTGRAEPDEPGTDGAAEALLATVGELAAEIGRGRAARQVGLDDRLDADLGLDSLSVAELLVRTEELFGVRLPDATLATARTVHDLLLAANGGPPGAGDIGEGPTDPGAAAPPSAPSGRGAVGGRRVGMAAGVHGFRALAVAAGLAVTLGPLVVLAPSLRLRWRLLRAAVRLLTVLTGTRVRLEGVGHLPSAGPFVLVANHASHVDPLVLVLLLDEPPVFAALADLADDPLLRLGLRRLGAHLVGRGDRVRGVADVGALTETVLAGRTVVFFPEGRRSPAAGLEPFRMGAFVVAARSGAPVVPVTLRGTRALLPVGRWLPRRATVRATVGPAIGAHVPGWPGAVGLHREARRQILSHSSEPDLA